MTREELKEHCKKTVESCEMWAKAKGEEPSGKVYEEHKLILELLEQEPCEDTISRQAVDVLVDELARAISDERCYISRGRSTVTIMRDILYLPSVTPKGVTITDFADKCRECGKQKKGKWVTKSHGFPLEPTTVCSECSFDRDFYIYARGFDKIKFCPNCGAKIESPQNLKYADNNTMMPAT